MGVDVSGQPVDLCLGEPEGLGHVPQHRPGPIGDHVGDHRRPDTSVPPVHVADHFLPPFGFQVEVDVGGFAPFLRQEPLEGQPQADGIDPGEAEAAAHRRVGAGSPDLAVDVLGSGIVDQVFDQQKEPGVPQSPDDVQFVVEASPGVRVDSSVGSGVDPHRPFVDQSAEPILFRVGIEGGKSRGDQSEVECEMFPQLRGLLHRPRIGAEPLGHLVGGLQMAVVGGRPEAVGLLQASSPRHRGEHLGQVGVVAMGIVDVVGRHHRDPQPGRQIPEGVVAGVVLGHQVVPQLDPEAITEQLLESSSLSPCPELVAAEYGLGDRSPVASG